MQVVNIYIVYEINWCAFTVGKHFSPGNSLIRAVKLTKMMIILININIFAMVLDMMNVENFHYLMLVVLVKT